MLERRQTLGRRLPLESSLLLRPKHRNPKSRNCKRRRMA
jgi:hypothetical protein